MPYAQDTTPIGTRFGRLVVTEKHLGKRSDGRNRTMASARCDCGAEIVTPIYNLKSGNTTSCGCYHREVVQKTMTTHGNTVGGRTRLYRIWKAMKQRCTNPNAANYRWYGGKGIKVCVEWENDFDVFLAWALAHGYADGLELDRKDSDQDYSPANCRWLTKLDNIHNKKRYLTPELDQRIQDEALRRGISVWDLIHEALESHLSETSARQDRR